MNHFSYTTRSNFVAQNQIFYKENLKIANFWPNTPPTEVAKLFSKSRSIHGKKNLKSPAWHNINPKTETPHMLSQKRSHRQFTGSQGLFHSDSNKHFAQPQKALQKLFPRDLPNVLGTVDRMAIRATKRICRKCKSRLLKSDKPQIEIRAKMFKAAKQKELESKVFKDMAMLREIKKQHKLSDTASLPSSQIWDEVKLFDNNLSELQTLASILFKKMTESPITQNELEIASEMDREILLLFLKKKMMCPKNFEKLTIETLNDTTHFGATKRIEENMKFTLNRFFRFIWDHFRKNLYSQVRRCLHPEFLELPEQAQFNYCFYGFYFEEAAINIRVRLEKFFHPQKSHGVLKGQGFLLPKSVSYLYFSFLKMSQLFVHDFKFFMRKVLISETKDLIGLKINKMCQDWEKIFFKKNRQAFLKKVRGFLKKNSKYKLAWSLREVRFAIEQIEGVLTN